jgi:hypothetical protein
MFDPWPRIPVDTSEGSDFHRKYDQTMPRHSTRWWAMFVVLSVENLVWLAAHPVQGWDAWKHRNDPPPPRSPAPTFDPDWAAKRRAAANNEEV